MFALGLLAAPDSAPAQPPSSNPAALRDALFTVIRAAHDAGTFDGIVLVAIGDRVVLRTAIGEADRAAHTPLTPDARIPFASVTKQLTAALVLQQLERDQASVDAPIGTWLPEFRTGDRARITVRHLLEHSSGLPDPDDIPDFYTTADTTITTASALLVRFAGTPLRSAPGATFAYNNLDYLILGHWLEQRNGRSYATLLDERIGRAARFRSVRMAPAILRPNALPVGYDSLMPATPPRLATYGASGGLLGTIDDLFKWDRALLTGAVLSPAMTATFFHANPDLGFVGPGSWIYDLKPVSEATPVRLVERQGEFGGWRLLNLIAPDRGWSIIIFANTNRADIQQTYAKRGLGFALLQGLAEAAAR